MRTRGLRLPLPRRPDPVLTKDELQFINTQLNEYIGRADAEMEHNRVSESVIRGRMYAMDARTKIKQVLDA